MIYSSKYFLFKWSLHTFRLGLKTKQDERGCQWINSYCVVGSEHEPSLFGAWIFSESTISQEGIEADLWNPVLGYNKGDSEKCFCQGTKHKSKAISVLDLKKNHNIKENYSTKYLFSSFFPVMGLQQNHEVSDYKCFHLGSFSPTPFSLVDYTPWFLCTHPSITSQMMLKYKQLCFYTDVNLNIFY